MKGKIFNAQEVQAILSGNKMQFRAICKRQPQGEIEKPYVIRQAGVTEFNYPFGKIPYQIGQKIFVKESFSTDWVNYDDTFGESCVGDISYEATWEKDNAKGFFDEPKWKPASQMKQEHSRLTLQIKEIRVERLADISEEDAIAEGVVYQNTPVCCYRYQDCCGNYEAENASWEFKQLWNATHKKPEAKWDKNPYVWIIKFEVENKEDR
jgi:hypothetical protein